MDHCGTKTIETERLILRAFLPEDIEPAYRNWMSDETVTKFLRWPAHKDVSVSECIINAWISQYKKADFYQWAIVL